MNLEEYEYNVCCYEPKRRLFCLQNAIQYHGYKAILKELLKMLNSQNSDPIKQCILKYDIETLFFPYDTMITSSGNFYSEELSMYV